MEQVISGWSRLTEVAGLAQQMASPYEEEESGVVCPGSAQHRLGKRVLSAITPSVLTSPIPPWAPISIASLERLSLT